MYICEYNIFSLCNENFRLIIMTDLITWYWKPIDIILHGKEHYSSFNIFQYLFTYG